MLRLRTIVAGILLFSSLGLVAGLSGCGGSAQGTGQPQTAATNDTHSNADAEIVAALAKLSPEDRALAEKQKICPVGDQPLGSMGTPVKLEVEGRTVFICCAACEGAVRENPGEHFRKLDGEDL